MTHVASIVDQGSYERRFSLKAGRRNPEGWELAEQILAEEMLKRVTVGVSLFL
jgi:hypothetical protein